MKSKTLNRIQFISNNALRQILVSVFSMAIPFIVIHFSSKEIWGSFVSPLLFSLLALQVINWGNKEYLLRYFSMEPNKIKVQYAANLLSRLPLVFIFSTIALFCFPLNFGIWLFIWLFGRYLVHSAESLIIYEKRFTASIIIESISFILFCLAFACFKNSVSVLLILILYSGYQLLKGIGYFLLFRNLVKFEKIEIDWVYFQEALPFFFLSILGFLSSKIDVYLIENLGNTAVTSDYQIINSLLVFTMSLSAFIYAPFTKNIYRNTESVFQKTKRTVALLGLIIVPVALAVIALVMHYFIHTDLPKLFFIPAFFYVYPSFIYGVEIVNLFRLKQEKKVAWYSFLIVVINSALTYLFLKFNCGILGALTGGSITQTTAFFIFKSKKRYESHKILL